MSDKKELSKEFIDMIDKLTSVLDDEELQLFLNVVANIRSKRSFKRYMRERKNK